MAKALTAISHGSTGKDGKVTPYAVEEGETVDKGKFTKEEWAALVEGKAVTEDDNASIPGSFDNTADNQNAADGSPVSTDDAETHQAKLDALAGEPAPEAQVSDEPGLLGDPEPPADGGGG
jgi:hypothetical protein